MPRTSVADWIKACNSQHGPSSERARHVVLLLAGAMFKGAEVGCFLSQRGLAVMIPCDKRTVARALKWLRENGWVDAEPRPSQWGQRGFTWRPAIPDSVLKAIGDTRESPIDSSIGDSRGPQSTEGGDRNARIGELRTAIGDLPSVIGDSRGPQNSLTEFLYQKDLNRTQQRQETRSVRIAQPITDAELAATVEKLASQGFDTAQICHVLGPHRASFERVAAALESLAAHRKAPTGARVA